MAILPLVGRLRLDATCLAIGAMAPDFEYFVRVRQVSTISHTWLGLLVWNVPVTIVLAIAFHHLVKWPLVLVAPSFLARRGAVYASRPWGARSWGFALACVASAAIGATTHMVWDGITHSDGMIASRVAALRTLVELPLGRDMVLHRVLQHASTAIGLLVVAIVVARALRRVSPVELPVRPRVWPRLFAVACIGAGTALGLLRLGGRRTDDIGNVVVVMISGALAGVVLASIVLHRAARRATPRARRIAEPARHDA
jgi:hypothetical protein